MTVRCIDIETTGTDPASDAIVEIASVDLQRDNTIANRQAALVRPGIPVPAEASAVHHLIDVDLAGAQQLEDIIAPFRGADVWRDNLGENGAAIRMRSGSRSAIMIAPSLGRCKPFLTVPSRDGNQLSGRVDCRPRRLIASA